MTDSFDDDRFAALLDLAGPEIAIELAQRLDEDLTNVGMQLSRAEFADHVLLHGQSHILVSIAGTIGATRLFHLAKSFNARALLIEPGALAQDLTELRAVLNDVILRIRLMRSNLDRPT